MSAKHWTVPARAASVIVVVAAGAIAGAGVVGAGAGTGVAAARSSLHHASAVSVRLTAERSSRTSPAAHKRSVAGKIREVDGVRTAGRCGTAGAKGTFVVANVEPSTSATVVVTSATRFVEPMTTRASFADVCVGRSVSVQGTTTRGVVSAVSVFVTRPGRLQPQGPVHVPVLPPVLAR